MILINEKNNYKLFCVIAEFHFDFASRMGVVCWNFRRFIRYFETLRAIHFHCVHLAFDLIRTKSWTGISGSARSAFRDFFDEYLCPIWKDRYGLKLMNCQGSFVMDNNFSEGWNRKYLLDLGMRQNWWTFLWNLKRFMAVTNVKYDAFLTHGFNRKRSAARRDRCKALQRIWVKFEKLNRTNKDIVWKYVECLYLCWEGEYDSLNESLHVI